MAGAQRAKEEWGRMGWRVGRDRVGQGKDLGYTMRARKAFEVFSTEP